MDVNVMDGLFCVATLFTYTLFKSVYSILQEIPIKIFYFFIFIILYTVNSDKKADKIHQAITSDSLKNT
jgi:hypothetical protein